MNSYLARAYLFTTLLAQSWALPQPGPAPVPDGTGTTSSSTTSNYKNCGGLIPNKFLVSLEPDTDLDLHVEWVDTLDLAGHIGVEKTYGFQGFKGYAGTFSDEAIATIQSHQNVRRVSQDTWFCPTGLTNMERDAADVTAESEAAKVWAEASSKTKLAKRGNVEQINAPANLRVVSQRPYPKSNSYIYNEWGGYPSWSYVVDTGIQINHQEFQGHAFNVWTGYNGNFSDVDGHGTFVAGIIGSKTWGLAKYTLLQSVKVFNGQEAQGSNVLDGFNWAVNDIVSHNRAQLSVINMSLGGGFNQVFNDAVTAAYRQNVNVVVAAGNGKTDVANTSPASCPEAITVAAITDNYSAYTFESGYSNYGSLVDLFAPGTRITSTAIGVSNQNTVTASGTSAAAPHVAGVIATWLAQGHFTTSQMAYFVGASASMDAISGVPAGTPNRLLYNWSGN